MRKVRCRMTARRAFGTTVAVLIIGTPLATLTAVAGFIAADTYINWRYKRAGNAPLIDVEAEFARITAQMEEDK